ncbi:MULTISPECIES: response regulator [unclassified Pseudomonas]|uniref:response regulator n=1 Tax=unclassified Pseudomonas TaxID=196821 RepID=UPI001474723C|nr:MULTISPECIES: response regulator [unclassified Pseudomonas]NMY37045.1 response regulator [Pseudomonas sp. WS 5078]NMY59639.1 response regulator [Pseudomonas sp. WS 5354]
MLNIIVADDHPVVVRGAMMTLSEHLDSTYTITGYAFGTDELIEKLGQHSCQLLITDYSMPRGDQPDGLALISYIRRHFESVKIIVMTMLNNPSALKALSKLGVAGLFDKHNDLSELVQAVRVVSKGKHYISPSFAKALDEQSKVIKNLPNGSLLVLSPKEIEVVRLFVQGQSGREIATRLSRSEKTISRQKRTAMNKLGLRHDCALMEWAAERGLRA